MAISSKLSPCLWFDNQAEAAAKFYVSVFPKSGIDRISHYGKAGHETHKRPEGSVMTVDFHLGEQPMTALNGGPEFKLTEAISLQILCETQDDVDHCWRKLTADGGKEGPCGWVTDKFGLSWQVVPTAMSELMNDSDRDRFDRAMAAMMTMKKLDIAALRKAADGK
jgi:predicted 3-demethylubiquinone-9 3-methyltransferase (glyoxalase superfamily)